MIPIGPRQWKQFWGKFDISGDSECWIWTGACKDFPTYCLFSDSVSVRQIVINNRSSKYDGFINLCGNPRCVNPDHQELPTDSYLGGKTSLTDSSLSSGGASVGDPTQHTKERK